MTPEERRLSRIETAKRGVRRAVDLILHGGSVELTNEGWVEDEREAWSILARAAIQEIEDHGFIVESHPLLENTPHEGLMVHDEIPKNPGWLSGYAFTVVDKSNQPLANYYGPTIAECEAQYTNDLQMGVFKPEEIDHCIAEWHDQLIEADSPAAEAFQ